MSKKENGQQPSKKRNFNDFLQSNVGNGQPLKLDELSGSKKVTKKKRLDNNEQMDVVYEDQQDSFSYQNQGIGELNIEDEIEKLNSLLRDGVQNVDLFEEEKTNKSEYLKLTCQQNIVKDEPLFDLDPTLKEKSKLFQDSEVIANQLIVTRTQPNGHCKVLWTIFNLEDNLFRTCQVVSDPVILQDNSVWYFIFKPYVYYDGERRTQVVVSAVPNISEQQEGLMQRTALIKIGYINKDGKEISNKQWEGLVNFTNENPYFNMKKFFLNKKDSLLKNKMNEQITMCFEFENSIYESYVEENVSSKLIPKTRAQKKSRLRKNAQFNGLVNEGTTCYMNSLLQTLFLIRAFRKAVFQIPNDMKDFKSIPFCLQRIFYNLQSGNKPVRTIELITSFGWSTKEMNMQHDVNEFNLILSDTLEQHMKDTHVAGTYKELFEGEFENVIKCEAVNFESTRKETFNCIQLAMKNFKSIEESIKSYISIEELSGNNQYDAGEEYGKQDAKKFIRFKKLPPVLQVQINRFDYDVEQDKMMKIDTQFEFGEILDLDSVLPNDQNMSQAVHSQFAQNEIKNVYHLYSILIHRGTLGAGHYFAFIKPTINGQWHEFNDSIVTPIPQNTALCIGGGGSDSSFEIKNGQIVETCKSNNTSAYMLIYIRESEIENIMQEMTFNDIPKQLKETFDEENKYNEKLDRDQKLISECGSIYLISFDIVKLWASVGLLQSPDDIYIGERFDKNEEQRMHIKIGKKKTVMDFLTMIRRKTKIQIKDINLYRLKYNADRYLYEFSLIKQEEYNNDIFRKGKNSNKSQIFYIMHNKEPNKQILKQFSILETTIRKEKNQKVIDFIERRDLDDKYAKQRVYKERIDQIWALNNVEGADDNSSIIDPTEEPLQQIFENDQEATQQVNNSPMPDDIHQINTFPVNQQEHTFGEKDIIDVDMEDQYDNNNNKIQPEMRLFFVKIYDKQLDSLKIVGQVLAEFNQTFQDVFDIIQKEIQIENLFNEIYIEFNCWFDKSELADINQNDNSFYHVEEKLAFEAGYVKDGSILILAQKLSLSEEFKLNELLIQYANEQYIDLIQMENDFNNNVQQRFGKVPLPNGIKVSEIYEKIKEQLKIQCNQDVEDGHIQLLLDKGGKTWENDEDKLINEVVFGNQINFLVLPFTLSQLMNNIYVEVQLFAEDNSDRGQIYKLMERDTTIWLTLKSILVNEMKDEGLKSGQTIMSIIDRRTQHFIRILSNLEKLLDVQQELQRSNSLLRLNVVTENERDLLTQAQNNNCGILFCTPLDSYHKRISNQFMVIVNRNDSISKIKEAVRNKLYSFRMMYSQRNNIYQEISQEEKQNAEINLLQFYSSRRKVELSSHSVIVLYEDQENTLDWPNLNVSTNLNIAVVIHVSYKEDEKQRVGHQLRIHAPKKD